MDQEPEIGVFLGCKKDEERRLLSRHYLSRATFFGFRVQQECDLNGFNCHAARGVNGLLKHKPSFFNVFFVISLTDYTLTDYTDYPSGVTVIRFAPIEP